MALEGGLRFIADSQLNNGGFAAHRLENNKIVQAKQYNTTFIASLTALALQEVPDSEAIREGVAHFLLAQKSDSWSWNYWDRDVVAAKKTPYPDDLDDSFLALTVLWKSQRTVFTPAVMADITHLLFATETRPGGPYRTWLVDDSAEPIWKDVDTVVNMNVAHFLALQDVELPYLKKLFDAAIRKREFASSYYPPLQPAAYFLSHFYKGRYTKKLQEHILSQQLLGTWETPHQTALAVSALLRLGYDAGYLERAIEFIADTQQADGSWAAGPVCWDIARREEYGQYYVGSSSLTTALCLEALALFDKAIKKEDQTPSIPDRYIEIVSNVRTVIEGVQQPELQQSLSAIVSNILDSDGDKQVVLLPHMVAAAVKTSVDTAVLHQLSVASIWGWAAYTIYDDFLDNEGAPALLPAAIFANRQLLATLGQTLSNNQDFQGEIGEIMTRLEAANAWEVNHCRGKVDGDQLIINELPDYRDYWQLADRSLGHTIAGLGVLYAAGLKQDSQLMNGFRKFFFHYLIARQLNDDAHDWEHDFKSGHINVVGAAILEKWLRDGRTLEDGIDFGKDMTQLQLIMWETVIDDICQSIHEHASHARAALQYIEGVDTSNLFAMLAPLEQAAIKALKTRDEVKAFSELL